MVEQYAEPAPRAGANASINAGSVSTPRTGSTTTPSTRRSSPQTRSSSAASWSPSTQMRLARATRAGASATAVEPDAVREDRAGGGVRAGRTRVTGSPSIKNPAGSSGKERRRPSRSTRVTAAASQPSTAPQNPDSASSATRPSVAATSGTTRRRRQSPASTSPPYRSPFMTADGSGRVGGEHVRLPHGTRD